MGYQSRLELDAFRTELTPDVLESEWKKHKESAGLKNHQLWFLNQYKWKLDADGYVLLDMEDDDYHSRHYHGRELAQFIAQIIAPAEHTILEFLGEDGGRWGYYITSGSVKDIEYVRMVDGKPIN